MRIPAPIRPGVTVLLELLLAATAGCRNGENHEQPTLSWYVFNEPSGAFFEAAAFCTKQSFGRYTIALMPLPPDADQQREQVARRLAASDRDIDIIGMDVIRTAQFAEAGWILAWPGPSAKRVSQGRLPVSVESARYLERTDRAGRSARTDRGHSGSGPALRRINRVFHLIAGFGGRPGARCRRRRRFLELCPDEGNAGVDETAGDVAGRRSRAEYGARRSNAACL